MHKKTDDVLMPVFKTVWSKGYTVSEIKPLKEQD